MSTKKRQKLLLHTCCAECAVGAIEALGSAEDGWEIALYYDNSNIHPRSEWLARLEAVKQIAHEETLELIVADWSPKNWYAAIDGNADNTNLRRCKRCWEMRIGATAEKAVELGIDSFSTTLLSSGYQNREEITEIGERVGKRMGLAWVAFERNQPEYERNKGESVDGRQKVFYRQNYCGCVYSLKSRMEGKWGE